jgi:hypothetical protein
MRHGDAGVIRSHRFRPTARRSRLRSSRRAPASQRDRGAGHRADCRRVLVLAAVVLFDRSARQSGSGRAATAELSGHRSRSAGLRATARATGLCAAGAIAAAGWDHERFAQAILCQLPADVPRSAGAGSGGAERAAFGAAAAAGKRAAPAKHLYAVATALRAAARSAGLFSASGAAELRASSGAAKLCAAARPAELRRAASAAGLCRTSDDGCDSSRRGAAAAGLLGLDAVSEAVAVRCVPRLDGHTTPRSNSNAGPKPRSAPDPSPEPKRAASAEHLHAVRSTLFAAGPASQRRAAANRDRRRGAACQSRFHRLVALSEAVAVRGFLEQAITPASQPASSI